MRVVRLDDTANPSLPVAPGLRTGADGSVRPVAWHLAEEAAIAFLLNGRAFAVMMATPADLEDFALGFLLTERVIAAPADLEELRVVPVESGLAINCIVPPGAEAAASGRRRSLAGRSGCGLCGAETLEAALPRLPRVAPRSPDPATVLSALRALPALQQRNARDRSTHAAAFFRADGTPVLVREDVGRHNALDKLGGALLGAGIDPATGFAVLSSRMSVEMVQKAAILGLPLLASVSAPTGLALSVAARAGLSVCAQSGDGVVVFGAGGPR